MVELGIERKSNFIILNNKTFVKYYLIFRVSDSYSISTIFDFQNKHQLIFQKLDNKNQQLNLMFVDSLFVNILADLTLEVFINKIYSINEYIESKTKIRLVKNFDDSIYLRSKFNCFIQQLLYSNISSKKLYCNELNTDRIYCYKNSLGKLEFYTIYEQMSLLQKLFLEMKIEIDYQLSSLINNRLRLCFKIII